MSQFPRRVLSDVYVTWGEAGCPPLFVRHGSVVDIPSTTSPLGLAYGGAANLSPVIPLSQRGNEQILDKSWLAN